MPHVIHGNIVSCTRATVFTIDGKTGGIGIAREIV